ncbi:MAG TPA: ATP-binding protein [Marmoricola sp.]|nr:ATP-binding protein [Marmoricola sp.]
MRRVSAGFVGYGPAPLGAPAADDRAPELADVRRYGRRLVRRFVAAAREDEQPRFATIIAEHLQTDVAGLDVVEEGWPPYDHVNLQAGLDAWLADGGRTHELVGMVNFRHHDFSLADLLQGGEWHGPRPGNVARVNHAIGPDGEALACVRCGVYLVVDGEDRLAMLLREGDPHTDQMGVSLQIVANRPEAGVAAGQAVRRSALAHNVHRGQVLSFGADMYGERTGMLRFHRRPAMSATELILPVETFADIERQVVGVARHRTVLREAGQHLKRGLLLYGPPGVGKTHTVRYLTSQLRDTTIVQLSGGALHLVREACSIARALQPALIVVEDVDLIAEERDRYGGAGPLLFTLLNEMDGLEEDADVVFLLTTNRADLLEEALAARPGRVDQAVEIALPDLESRRRLFELYRGRLDVDSARLDDVLERSAGVTASFLKELLRRAAVLAANAGPAEGPAADREGRAGPGALRVSADDLDAALDDLLATRNAMTRRALGAGAPGLPVAPGRAEPGLAPPGAFGRTRD